MSNSADMPRRAVRDEALRPLAALLRDDLTGDLGLAEVAARDPFTIADALGVRIEYLPLAHGCGRLFRERDGWTIVLPETASEARQRFACAHELGHYLIHDRRGDVRQALAGWGQVWGERRVEEWVCDLFAQELLLPARAFAAAIGSLDLAAFLRLVRDFRTSLQAAAIRVATLSAAYAFVRAAPSRNTARHRTRLVVEWTATPPPVFLPTRKRIEEGSCLTRSLTSRRAVSDWEADPLGALKGWYHTEAAPLERTVGVVALIHLNRRHNERQWRQMSLFPGCAIADEACEGSRSGRGTGHPTASSVLTGGEQGVPSEPVQ